MQSLGGQIRYIMGNVEVAFKILSRHMQLTSKLYAFHA